MSSYPPNHSDGHSSCTTQKHGVFMNIFNLGVLLTGESGSGKSEVALSLLDRGHQLVADDIILFALQNDQTLLGTCPAPLQNQLEIRGLGIFDVTLLFGKKAIMDKQTLSLVVHLEKSVDLERKTESNPTEFKKILDVQIPHITLPYQKERRFDILIETFARHHLHQKSLEGTRS